MAEKYVAYYRVSTDRQGKSGLGLDAQRKAVLDYIKGNGSKLIAEHTEIESGKRNDRPELAKALAECKREGAMLVIAKLDRLARNVAFIANLMESKVEFVAVDFPTANKLTVHILAAVAEHEREVISDRTKKALAARKARGKPMGCLAHTKAGLKRFQQGRLRGAATTKAKAERFAANVLPIIREVQAAGVTSLRGIARTLNARGVKAARGGLWDASTVRGVLRRVGG